MHITGKTKDGVYTIGGCFSFYATHGVPVSLIVETLHNNHMIVDWVAFCIDALQDEWTLGKAYNILREAVGDTYSPAWVAEWNAKIVRWCTHRWITHGAYALWATQGQGGAPVAYFGTLKEALVEFKEREGEASFAIKYPDGTWHDWENADDLHTVQTTEGKP